MALEEEERYKAQTLLVCKYTSICFLIKNYLILKFYLVIGALYDNKKKKILKS